MFPTFTGQSRRSRNVNLSGKKKDQGSTARPRLGQSSTAPGAQSSILNAQQERDRRTAERKRLGAAITIQRAWRRSMGKSERRDGWRRQWDDAFNSFQTFQKTPGEGSAVYRLDSEVLYLLLWILWRPGAFVEADLSRISKLAWTLSRLPPSELQKRISMDPGMLVLLRRLFVSVLSVLDRPNDLIAAGRLDITLDLLEFASFFSDIDPHSATTSFNNTLGTQCTNSTFYKTLANLLDCLYRRGRLNSAILHRTLQTAIAPISKGSFASPSLLLSYVSHILTIPNFPHILSTGDGTVHLKSLLNVSQFVHLTGSDGGVGALNLDSIGTDCRLALLSSIIAMGYDDFLSGNLDDSASLGYVRLLTMVFSSVAGEISRRIAIEDDSMEEDGDDEFTLQPLPAGVRDDVMKLKEKTFILRVFEKGFQSGEPSEILKQASFVAYFALALLFIFPNNRQDLRIWMCLADNTSTSEPLVKYLWEATKLTEVYHKVRTLNSRLVDTFVIETFGTKSTKEETIETLQRDEQWRIALLFLELYGFLLVLMDDEEFFAGGEHLSDTRGNKKISASALPLKDIEELTLFLKNFAFAIYWRAQDFEGALDDDSGADTLELDVVAESTDCTVVGVRGMSIIYVKGIVTTLIRQLYSRDSRRRFLPEGHWLMTHRFEMEGFIPAVVLEEEQRHAFEEEEEDEDDDSSDVLASPYNRLNARLQKYKDSKLSQRTRRYITPIAPRLEILQTLPFFIPFNTRVKIFREFIKVDYRRRHGELNFNHTGRETANSPRGWVHPNLRPARPSTFDDAPRQGGLMDNESRTVARIRRERILDDAFKALYPLGEGIKEPVRIIFIDKYGEEEAGIDGGGVTKEFLISITKEAFLDPKVDPDSPLPPIKLFEENSNHALYPNPTSLLQLIDWLEDVGIDKSDYLNDMLRKYEFLGRIVGKCMYEGILIDVAFATSFLLKWSHRDTGANDGYKPSVNDIRDLDEDLYQGLISLKNYPGDVEAELSLNFAVTLPLGPNKNKTMNIIPNGSSVPVTNSNRLQYLHAMAHFRLQALPERQTTAFLRGLGQIIRPTWLSMFNQSELQTLVGGDTSALDIDDLRANTIYSGLYEVGTDRQEHPTIQLFWEVMKYDLTEEQRRSVVKFVTSVSRAPLLGFRVLNPKFAIRDSIGTDDLLPSSSTCVNLLKLPVYRSRKKLKEKLIMAVENVAGFHLS